MSKDQTFASFFQAGFECSSHRRRDGVRLDLIRATSHDRHVARRLSAVRRAGAADNPGRIALAPHRDVAGPATTGRAGCLRWRPAEGWGCRSFWDLFHYGSPDSSTRRRPISAERFHGLRNGCARSAPIGRAGRPPCGLPAQRNQLRRVGRQRGDISSRRTQGAGWFKRQLVRAAIVGTKRSAAMAGFDDRVGRAADPRRSARQTSVDRKNRGEQNLQGMYEAYDWIMGLRPTGTWRRPILVEWSG